MSARPLKILIVDDEPTIRKMLALSLGTAGYESVAVTTPSAAMAEAAGSAFDVALVDLRLGAEKGLDLIPRLLSAHPWLKIIVITAYASIDTAVEAVKRGAADYLPKPFTPAQVRLAVERVAERLALERRVADLQAAEAEAGASVDLQSGNAEMKHAVELARQVAASDATLLIRGESGTGKGILARAIHGWSSRAQAAFATVSCPTLSPQLLESELFGHVKGAFTGAVRDQPGRIAASEAGTLFLDEIGDLPLALQPKLLRFVQDREYERVGDAITRQADVRVITATNIDLAEAVRAGQFREDLLYRINVIQIDLPPLRRRPEDVLPLAQRMLSHFSRGRPIEGFSDEAADALRQYAWPGNIRELRKVVERAVILCRGARIGAEQLPANFASRPTEPRLGDPVPFEQIDAIHIRRLIARSKTIEEAASVLGIDAATLWRKRKKYGI